MNILINEFSINNPNYVIEQNDNNIFLTKINDISSNIMSSFGIFPKINPFLYKNKFESILKFDYEFSDDCNIKIYNGKKWINFIGNKKGKFKETIILEECIFTNFKSKWRIGFTENVDKANLTNIELTVEDSNKPKLLIIGSSIFSILDLNNISDFNSINTYYYKKYLNKNYNIIICSLQELLINMYYLNFDIKCSIMTQLQGLNKQNWSNELLTYFLNKVKKVLISTDMVNDQYIMENTSFNKYCYFIPSLSFADKYKEKVSQVYWAADDEIFYSKKDKNKFIILIDDCHYGQEKYADEKYHKNYEILDHCINIMNTNNFVYVYRFGFYDKSQNFIDKYKNKYDRYTVIEEKIPLLEKAEFHNIANVFWATHYETLGLPNIESAMSGCLLIHPKGFVNKRLTQHLDHIDYTDIEEITIDKMINKFIPDKQREKALEFTWEKKCEKIHNFIM